MFGSLKPHAGQLTSDAQDAFRSSYCGLCHQLREQGGRGSSLLLTYDLTFLSLFARALEGEHSGEVRKARCTAMPLRSVKVPLQSSKVERAAASISVVLAHLKCQDDIEDDRSLRAKLALKFLQPKLAKAVDRLTAMDFPLLDLQGYGPAQLKAEKELRAQEPSWAKARTAAEPTARMSQLLFGWAAKEGGLERTALTQTQKFGWLLGEMVYLMDAVRDLPQDQRSGSFNPLRGLPPESVEQQLLELRNTLLGSWRDLAREGPHWQALTSALVSACPAPRAEAAGGLANSARRRRKQAAFIDCDGDGCGPEDLCLEGLCCITCEGTDWCCWASSSSRREREMQRVHGDLLEQLPGTTKDQELPNELERLPVLPFGKYACPGCLSEPMERQEVGRGGLFHCEKCGGVWVNPVYLRELKASPASRQYVSFPQNAVPPAAPPGTRKCPDDQSTLIISREKGVSVEECPQCQCWYLDPGELGTLLS